MLKNKQLIIGILIGALVFGGIPAFAATGQYILTQAQYKIVVNGVKYTDTENPILNYNGTTYVPLRAIGKLLGQEPKWNEEKKQVEIGSTGTEPDSQTWIRAKEYNSINSEVTNILVEQMADYKTPGVYTLEYNGFEIKMQIYDNKTYLNIQDLINAGVYTE